jgi:nucleotide-binding universal stress UspA family protein
MSNRRALIRFRSILCPVDFSLPSRYALRYAADLARRFRAQLTVLFIDDPLLMTAARHEYGGDRGFVEASRAELLKFVRESVRNQATGIDLRVGAGNPGDEILRIAKRLRSDLVVMGTHGSNRVVRFFFGSTTEQVLASATLPVLAVPPPVGRRASPRIGAIDRVICPIDLTGVWESDAIRAADIARMFDVPLLLVHVLRRLRAVPWLPETNRPRDRDRIATATTALQRVSARLPQGVRSTSAVLVGDPAHEIARLARRAAPLVVMSLRGTRAVWGRRGAIAYQVLASSSSPVLALPRRQLGGPLETRLRRTVDETLSTRDRSEIAGIDALLSVGRGAKS